jgi:hypothetical protein
VTIKKPHPVYAELKEIKKILSSLDTSEKMKALQIEQSYLHVACQKTQRSKSPEKKPKTCFKGDVN